MKEFSPEDIQKMTDSRDRETRRLKRGGAVEAEKSRLHITPTQFDEAHREMRKDLSSRAVKRFEGKSEITESRVFDMLEIQKVIAETEGVDPKNIIPEQKTVDSADNAIWMDFKLKVGIAYSRYHRPTEYIFQIKGVFDTKETLSEVGSTQFTNKFTEIKREYLFTDPENTRAKETGEYGNLPKGEIIARYINGKWTTYGPLLDDSN